MGNVVGIRRISTSSAGTRYHRGRGTLRVALYARVSTTRQAQAQTIEQQLQRLQAHAREHGWTLAERQIFRDDGYSGASLQRPGLDALRDQAGVAEFAVVLVTAPDRLARKYVHQVLLIEELERCGCRVEFLDRPMSQDPHDQLLLQIRGAVAEYERTRSAERMRRGRLAKLRAGQLLPWAVPPYGFRTDPARPRDPAGVRHDADEALIVQQLFSWYLEPGTTLHRLVKRLRETAVPTPSGRGCWRGGTVRNILRNPAYAGQACGNRYRCIPAHQRSSALRPTGKGISHRLRPEDEWVTIAVPPLVSRGEFDLVHAKLAQNQQTARRNNRSHQYLLRGLLNCGRCQLSCTGSTRNGKYMLQGRYARAALDNAGRERAVDEPPHARRIHLVALAGAFTLLVPPSPGAHISGPRYSRLLAAMGLGVEMAGFAMAFWARATLGQYWTGRVALTAEQPLLRTGPYRYIRHPLYTGLLAAVLGQAFVLARPRGFAAFALLAFAYRRKVSYEEDALQRHFGTEYAQYSAAVPPFLPTVSRKV